MPVTARSKIVRASDSSEAQFVKLSGQPVRSGTELDAFARPGIDGLSLRKMARRGRPFVLVGMRDFATMDDATNSFIDLVANLQGELCTIYDSSGIEHTDMVCLRVVPREPIPVLLGVGGLVDNFGAIGAVDMEFVYRK